MELQYTTIHAKPVCMENLQETIVNFIALRGRRVFLGIIYQRMVQRNLIAFAQNALQECLQQIWIKSCVNIAN
jgi:hypothetical protein